MCDQFVWFFTIFVLLGAALPIVWNLRVRAGTLGSPRHSTGAPSVGYQLAPKPTRPKRSSRPLLVPRCSHSTVNSPHGQLRPKTNSSPIHCQPGPNANPVLMSTSPTANSPHGLLRPMADSSHGQPVSSHGQPVPQTTRPTAAASKRHFVPWRNRPTAC